MAACCRSGRPLRRHPIRGCSEHPLYWVPNAMANCLTRRSFLEAKQFSLEEQSIKASIGLTTLAHESSKGNDLLQSVLLSILVGLSTKNVRGHSREKQTRTLAPCPNQGEGEQNRRERKEMRHTPAISIWTEAWSLAVMSLLVAEHFLGM